MASGSGRRSARSASPRRSMVREDGPRTETVEHTTWYVESSALLAAELEGDVSLQRALRAPGLHITSALTLAEAHRAIVRAGVLARQTSRATAEVVRGLEVFARRCEIVAVTGEVLARAGRPFPIEPVRTLDAIHLATIELLGEAPQLLTVLTRVARVRENARALGYQVA